MTGYTPHTKADIQEMFSVIGISSIDELFAVVPAAVKNSASFNLSSLSEQELTASVKKDLSLNKKNKASFLGAGCYEHYIPAVVSHLAGRSEFYTAYTPYQPEISQGTLSVIYEFQSMICELAGLDISNASLYDGATACAEAALMALNNTKRDEIVLANALHPNYKEVLKTYIEPRCHYISDSQNVSEKTAAVIFSLPNFYGSVESLKPLVEKAKAFGALVIVNADPLLLSVLEAPGKLGADIVVGEGRPLGIPMSLGGPALGFMSVKKELLRFMPGRIVGRTVDAEGRAAFVLTMQTREQHIRREKATSNICSNQALCALMATVYLSVMGPAGLQHVVGLIQKRVNAAITLLEKIPGFKVLNKENCYREFVLECPVSAAEINKKLSAENIAGGYDLGGNKMLICCTELTADEQIKLLAEKIKIFAKEEAAVK